MIRILLQRYRNGFRLLSDSEATQLHCIVYLGATSFHPAGNDNDTGRDTQKDMLTLIFRYFL
jgi:hypothetical protein